MSYITEIRKLLPRKKCYLIDMENVSWYWLKSNFDKNANIILFMGKNLPKLSLTTLEQFNTYKNIKIIRAKTGDKNALDFQLISYLGYLIKKNPNMEYYVVSNDNGYNLAIEFWQQRNVKVCRIPVALFSEKPELMQKLNLYSEYQEIIIKALNNISIENKELIIKQLCTSFEKGEWPTNNAEFHNYLQKLFSPSIATKVYNGLKPQLKTLRTK